MFSVCKFLCWFKKPKVETTTIIHYLCGFIHFYLFILEMSKDPAEKKTPLKQNKEKKEQDQKQQMRSQTQQQQREQRDQRKEQQRQKKDQQTDPQQQEQLPDTQLYLPADGPSGTMKSHEDQIADGYKAIEYQLKEVVEATKRNNSLLIDIAADVRLLADNQRSFQVEEKALLEKLCKAVENLQSGIRVSAAPQGPLKKTARDLPDPDLPY